ncbi:hypothetical protein RJZ56_003437 [Blastomyces dermatitidis]
MDKPETVEPLSTIIDGPEGSEVLIFNEATTTELQVKCFKIVGASFGWPLPEADYIEREKFLMQRPLTHSNGVGIRWWCLQVQGGDGSGRVVATCKTLNRDLLIRTAAGGTREGQGYCIGAVATDKRYRRLGLAEFLLRAVARWMDGSGEAEASMLYSSIGKSVSLCLISPNRSGLPPTQPLMPEDIPALCARDIENIKAKFSKDKPAADKILMTTGAAFISRKTNGQVPPFRGAINEYGKTWVYWHHDFPDRELTIQRVVTAAQATEDKEDEGQQIVTLALASLLLAALDEAQKWKLHKLVIWNPTAELHHVIDFVQEQFGVDVINEERVNSNVPSVRWGGGNEDKTSEVVVYHKRILCLELRASRSHCHHPLTR